MSASREAPVDRPDELVVAYDERGREVRIKRVDWVRSVLLPALDKAWDDPHALRQHVVQGLRDDFAAQIADASDRLVTLENESNDALVIAAVVRLELDDLDRADWMLERALTLHGPSGLVLTNQAKVLDRRGRIPESRAVLRRSLDLDPNDSNALLWWAVLAREASGEAAYVSALEEIAAVANAWRPQLYLAREALKRGDRASALRLYDHVLARAADGPNVLMTMTGDLGNAGALDDLVRLAAPLYRPEQHGPEPGFNLIRAYKALGRIDDGRALVRRLQAMQWKPFATMLATLESELASAQLPQPEAKPPQIVLVPFHDPLWTRGLFEPTWLLRSHDDDEPTIAFFPLANETTNAGGAQVQKADDAGRLTRGIPLFLAETLRLQFRVRTPMTALVANGHGPVVFGERMAPAEVARWVEASAGRRIAVTGAWTAHGVDLDVGDLGNDDPPTRLHVEGSLADVNALLLAARSALLTELDARGVLVPARAPSLWALPPERLVGAYVSALEQLFTQLLASNGLVDAKTLWNERGFFESYFGLVEAWPSAPESARLIAACGVVTATKYGSDVVGPYRTMLLGWIDHAPEGSALAKMAPGILKVLGESERLAKWMQNASMMQEASYAEWLARVAASP